MGEQELAAQKYQDVRPWKVSRDGPRSRVIMSFLARSKKLIRRPKPPVFSLLFTHNKRDRLQQPSVISYDDGTSFEDRQKKRFQGRPCNPYSKNHTPIKYTRRGASRLFQLNGERFPVGVVRLDKV